MTRLFCAAVPIMFGAAAGSAQTEPAAPPYAWVQYDFEGRPAVRVVIEAGNDCPAMTHSNGSVALHLRTSTPPTGFEAVHVCEGLMPAGVEAPMVGQLTLPVPTDAPARIVVIGDTGCRSKGRSIQNCNGTRPDLGPQWNYVGIAEAAAGHQPDLLIHVGDYHYREEDCQGACDPATVGFTWESWQADFFAQSVKLFAAAPWIHTRGNHEDCTRAIKGWFYLLDPRPYPTAPLPLIFRDGSGNESCGGWDEAQTTPSMSSWIFTDPYAVTFADRQFIVMDTSYIHDDYLRAPEEVSVARYAGEFATVEAMANAVEVPTWLVTHRPFWAVASYGSQFRPMASATDTTLQAAIDRHGVAPFSAAIELLLAGHIHLFQAITFADERPSQLVFGNSGTLRDPALSQNGQLSGPVETALSDIGADTFLHAHDFDFGIISPVNGVLDIEVRAASDDVISKFTLTE
jgi:hypothetical protein